ncbi:DNA polymerase III subunit beta [Rossellomorea sp. BNER]|uniref:DNA polymerase III subunit beta n=1 Tax=Rossellomorea sp. BNER TaxID=2962031 RepID=UPI003AF22784|nr:DNA polymerase III subunit beta [Rossellomorea sp. BNER]
MEFKLDSDLLKTSLIEVSRAISNHPTIHALSGVMIKTTTNELTLIGMNSERIIKKVIPSSNTNIEIIREGCMVIPAKSFLELVKKLPDRLYIKQNQHKMNIISNDIYTSISEIPSKNFPQLPDMPVTPIASFQSNQLKSLIMQTCFAASEQEIRHVINGVQWSFNEKKIQCTATNSHRLATVSAAFSSQYSGSIIIPKKNLQEYLHLIKNDGQIIRVFLTEHYLLLEAKDLLFYSRLISGSFPDISKMIPSHFSTEIVLNRKKFLEGMERANLLSSKERHHNVTLKTLGKTVVEFTSLNNEIGEIIEKQRIDQLIGKEIEITFDGNFMKDTLKSIDDEQVRLGFNGSLKPIVIQPLEDSSFTQIISPIRTPAYVL